jgi:serine/threonine protein phosphatase PrpC
MVQDEEIQKIIVSNPDIRDACSKLIARANEHGGEDNVTAVLIKIEEQVDAPTEEIPAAKGSTKLPREDGPTDAMEEATSPMPGVRPK